ncbi:MAG: YitT family protein [Erysipelotrichaceae bacterium]|nr:YitT family protein [Erysipelotrichaceae bacterium]
MLLKKELKDYFIIALGTFILTFGVYNIHSRGNISEGGVLGLILFLAHWFKINPSISSIILDYSLMILAQIILGGNFLKYSLFSSVCFSVFYYILSFTSPVLTFVVKNDLLSAIVGAIFVGVGVGLVVKIGGACGGDDSLAMILSKKFNLKISRAYLISDIVVLLLSLSYIPIDKIIYSLITVLISSNIIEYIKSR